MTQVAIPPLALPECWEYPPESAAPAQQGQWVLPASAAAARLVGQMKNLRAFSLVDLEAALRLPNAEPLFGSSWPSSVMGD